MNNPILIELKQKDFELEMKDKIIEEQNNEMEQQQTLISNLKDELQHLKTEADIKLDLQEKMIEKLKIELEVYITEIKKKMNGWKKKHEPLSVNPIQRNSNTPPPVKTPSDQATIQTNVTPKLEIKTENIPINIIVIGNPESIEEHKLSKNQNVFPNNFSMQRENKLLKVVNPIKEIYSLETEKDFQPNEIFSEIKIQNSFSINSEVAEVTTFPIDTISASEQNEPSQTSIIENEMEIQSDIECTEREYISEVKTDNKIRPNAEVAKQNSSLTAKDSIGDCNQENVSTKTSKLTQCKIFSKAFQDKAC
jgi:hypothetical protein